MKRALVLGVLLLAAAQAAAMTSAEIHCAVLGMGGGQSTSASHALRSYIGPAVVGVSTSTSHDLVHGPVPCLTGVTTGVDAPGHDLPTVLRLHQNAPNPFNPHTTIQYDVPRDALRVQLRVCDVSGRVVRTLVDEAQTAGRKSVVWNGRDDSGREVSSGVYLYELIGPDQRITKKMTLLK
jgi:hypothetical protein